MFKMFYMTNTINYQSNYQQNQLEYVQKIKLVNSTCINL